MATKGGTKKICFMCGCHSRIKTSAGLLMCTHCDIGCEEKNCRACWTGAFWTGMPIAE